MAIAAVVMAGLRKLPREAVPETLERVMQATGVDSVTLLSGLLRAGRGEVDDLAQRLGVETAETGTDAQNLIMYVAALLYLLKDSAQDDDVVDKVVWTICIPLLRVHNPRLCSLQVEVIELMVNTVAVLGLWRSMPRTLERICLQTFISAAADVQGMAGSNWEESRFLSNSCQLVGALLELAIGKTQETTSLAILDTDTVASAEYFCIEVVYMFIEPALAFLSQPYQTSLRHLVIFTLLPPILRTITKLRVTPTNLIRSKMSEIGRSTTVQQIWESCKILFRHGHLQRHDAYVALAVFTEYLLPPVQLEDEPKNFGVDYFDIRKDPFFWDELKAGLAHDGPLIRERALCVLKQALLNYSGRPDDPNDSKCRENCAAENIRLERWSAFVFLYEMLDRNEGFHLAEDTLVQKLSFLLPFSKPKSGEKRPWTNPGIWNLSEGVDVNFTWMSVLFQRGFNHEIVRVRQMVFRSFLELDWPRAPKVKAFVPEGFVLGPFLSSLDDPVQYQEFDRGPSNLSILASEFIRSYSASLSARNLEGFIQRFAQVFAAKAPCRAGLMSFAVCLEAATTRLVVVKAEFPHPSEAGSSSSPPVASEDEILQDLDDSPPNSNEIGSDVLDNLQLVVEKSRHCFDQECRVEVFEHILVAAASMNQVPFMLVSRLAKFITCFPRELLQEGGCLHDSLLEWIHPSPNGHTRSVYPRLNSEEWLRRGLVIMMEEYLTWGKPSNSESLLCKDDLRGWEESAQRWARLVAIGVVSSETQKKLVLLVERCLAEIYQRAYMVPRVAEKTLLLFRCLLRECEGWACAQYQPYAPPSLTTNNDGDDHCSGSRLTNYVADSLLNILDVLVQNAKISAGVFWEYHGLSMLRVPFLTEPRSQVIERKQGQSVTASAVMQGVLAVTTLAEGCIWYCRFRSAAEIPEDVINFFWDFSWKVVTTPAAQTEASSEVQLGSYEALVTVCGAWAATVSPCVVSKPMTQVLGKDPFIALSAATVVENLVIALGANVQAIMRRELLTKTQCDALVCYKWSSLEYLLSISPAAVAGPQGVNDLVNQSESSISISVLQDTLQEAIDSLESAGEDCLVPLLRSIRWIMHWDVLLSVDPTEEAQDKSFQIMWSLVQSGWATIANNSQPRVAVWAAFLSAIFHPTVFGDQKMHEAGIHEDDGPLKWLICRLITKGDSIPWAMRLTAIYMAGLWLQFPATLACYSDQLKALVLLGEEVAHECVDGDARENQNEAIEDIMRWRINNTEISEAYFSSEAYAHVTIAVMLHLVAHVVETAEDTQDNETVGAVKPGAECGRKLLFYLLTHVVEDSELSKKQYASGSSDTQRQKLRAWQVLCILSQYVSGEEVDQVISLLRFAIESNRLPSVRRYIEAFAIRVFLKFPSLVEKHIVPVLHDNCMKAQALSTYISIAVNVVLCTSSADLRRDHIRQVLPAIYPFMTTNHRNPDAFTQVLVYHILQKWINGLEQISSGPAECVITDHSCIDRRCLQSLAKYMEANADYMRLKPSVELYLDTFDPVFATSPEGVFCKQGQDFPTETNDVPIDRVSVAVIHQIFHFLNSSKTVPTEATLREDFIRRSECSPRVLLSRPRGKELVSGSRSVSNHGQSEQLHNLVLSLSGTSPKTRSSGSVDLASRSSDDASISQKLYPKVRIPFQRPGNDFDRSYKSQDNSSLETLGLQKHGQCDRLRINDPHQEFIVVATGQADSAAYAGFARTCQAFETARLVVANTSQSQEHHDTRFTSTCSLPYEILDTSLKKFLNHKKREGFSLLGLEKGPSSVFAGNFSFCNRSVLILGGEYGIPSDIVPMLDELIEVTNPNRKHPLDVFVSASIVLWEYSQQHHPPRPDVTTPALTDADKLVGAQVYGTKT